MVFLALFALGAGLVRMAAPHVRDITAGRELAKPGMNYIPLGERRDLVDGVWAPEEIPAVLAAAQGTGPKDILRVGKERAEALRRAGCPCCTNTDCGLLFPIADQVPEKCSRCGGNVRRPVG